MFKSMKKTLYGLKISYQSVKNFKLWYSMMVLGFGFIFISAWPVMVILDKFYKQIEIKPLNLYDAFIMLLPYLALAIFLSIVIIIVYYPLSRLSMWSLSSMMENILDIILKNRPGTSKTSMGDTLNSIKEDPNAILNTFDNISDLPGRLIYFVAGFIMVWKVDHLIAIVLLFPMFSVTFFSNLLSNKMRAHNKESRKRAAKVSSHLGDIVTNILTIKVNGAKDDVTNELIRLGEKRRESTVKTQVIRELMWKTADISIGISFFLILVLSAAKLKNGDIDTGDLFVLTYFPTTAYLVHLIGRVTSMSNASVVSYERIEKIIGKENAKKIFDKRNAYVFEEKEDLGDIKKLCGEGERTLSIKNLSSTFNGLNGVRNVNLNLKDGEFLAITGRIGSGKSTLMKTLIDSKEMDEGEISYCGYNLKNIGLIPPFGSYTPQNVNLFSDTIKNNIILDQEYDEDKFNKVIDDSVLRYDLENLTNKENTLIGSKGVKLSGGQKQRVAVARMLYQDSEVYLLDDVSSALDVRSENQLWDNLKSKDKTRIAITNRQSALLNADRILVLKDGKVDSIGRYSDLLKESAEFREIFNQNQHDMDN